MGTQPEAPEGDEGARRAELEEVVGALQERMGLMAPPRESHGAAGRAAPCLRDRAKRRCGTAPGSPKVFNEHAPSDGEAAQVYADAARVVRAGD